MISDLPIAVDQERLARACRRWRITELALFGSVLRDDFGPESDVDVMVVFEPDAPWSYFDWPDIQDDLSAALGGRTIDLVERRSIVNPWIRQSALAGRRVMYAA